MTNTTETTASANREARYHSQWMAECERLESAADEIIEAAEECCDDIYNDQLPLTEAFSIAADMLRVYPSPDDGEHTVDTCYLVDDLDSVIRRLEMIRDGAWMVPVLGVSIAPDELTGLARRLTAVVRILAKPDTLPPHPA